MYLAMKWGHPVSSIGLCYSWSPLGPPGTTSHAQPENKVSAQKTSPGYHTALLRTTASLLRSLRILLWPESSSSWRSSPRFEGSSNPELFVLFLYSTLLVLKFSCNFKLLGFHLSPETSCTQPLQVVPPLEPQFPGICWPNPGLPGRVCTPFFFHTFWRMVFMMLHAVHWLNPVLNLSRLRSNSFRDSMTLGLVSLPTATSRLCVPAFKCFSCWECNL